MVELIERHLGNKGFPKQFWDAFMSRVEGIAAGACVNTDFSQTTLKNLVHWIVHLMGLPEADKLQKRDNVSSVLRMLDSLASASFGAAAAKAGGAGASPLQVEVLEALEALSLSFQRRPADDQLALWSEIVSLLQAYMPGAPGDHEWAKGFLDEGVERHPSPGMTPATAALLSQIYSSHMPEGVQGMMLGSVAVGFLVCLCHKHKERQPELWQPGVKGFISTVSVGARALNSCQAMSRSEKEKMWVSVAKGMRAFLLPDESEVRVQGVEALEDSQSSEQLDIKFIDCMVDDLVPLALTQDVVAELLRILDDGVESLQHMPTVPAPDSWVSYRFNFAERCLHALFELSSFEEEGRGGNEVQKADDVAMMAAPTLIKRCGSILQQFVVDEAQACDCPLPRARVEQVIGTARLLQDLELSQAVGQHVWDVLGPHTAAGSVKMMS
jgi:hypothetical protein